MIIKPNKLVVAIILAFFLLLFSRAEKGMGNTARKETKGWDTARTEGFAVNQEFVRSEGLFKSDVYANENPDGLFKNGNHADTRAGHEEYPSGFRDGSTPHPALMETGRTGYGQESWNKNVYNRSDGYYPEAGSAVDPKIIADMEGYYYRRNYRKVIEMGMVFFYRAVSSEKRFKICDMVARSYAAIGSPNQGIRLLKEFIATFPHSEKAEQARTLVGMLGERAYEGAFLHDDKRSRDDRQKYDRQKYDAARPTGQSIGCLLPLTGPYEIYGKKALKGIQLALMNFSSNNFQTKIIIKDTGSDPDMSLHALKELDESGVSAIIGPLTTIAPVANESQSRKIPIITLTQKENITNIGDYVFRNFLTPPMQVAAIVTYAFGKLGINRFAVLYPDEKYGKTFMKLFHDQVISYGGSIAGAESYGTDQTDFEGPIKRLAALYYERLKNSPKLTEKESADYQAYKEFLETDAESGNGEHDVILDFEAIFIPDSPEKTGLIMPQLAFHDIKNVYVFGTNLWHSEKLLNMAREYVQGAIMPDSFFKESSAAETKKFVADFVRMFDEEPGFIEALTYDTAMILFKLVSRAGMTSRERLRDAIMNLRNYPGVTGLTSFYPSGDVWKNLHLLKIKKNRFAPLETD